MTERIKAMKRKIVTAFMMAALGSSLVFSQAAMAADTTAQTETSEDADKDSEAEDKDAADDTKDADKADENKDEDLKTIGEKPEEDTEGVLSVKLKNTTGKVITGVAVKNEKDEEYPDNFLKEEDKFEADEERVLWFDPNAKDKDNKDAADDTKDASETEDTKTEDTKEDDATKTDEKADGEDKDDAEKEIPKYNIQLTFEDGTTAEIHTFPFGDTEEAELHLEGDIAYLVFDSISQKKEFNTLETEKALAPKPTEAAAQASETQSTQSYDNSSDYDYNNDYDYSNDYDTDYDYDSDYDYDYDGSDDGGSDDGGSDDGGNGCLDDGLLN